MEDGQTIAFEINESEPREGGGMTHASYRPGGIVEKAKLTFEQALSKVGPSTEKVIMMFRGLVHTPDEIEMEFGFNVNTALGAVIATTGAEANYKVTLRWKNKEHQEGQI
ncbi:MAG: CU044_2847 family protein [Ktedonobacteraceae bacterium]